VIATVSVLSSTRSMSSGSTSTLGGCGSGVATQPFNRQHTKSKTQTLVVTTATIHILQVDASTATIVGEILLAIFTDETNPGAEFWIAHVGHRRIVRIMAARGQDVINASTTAIVPEGRLLVFADESDDSAFLGISHIVDGGIIGVVARLDSEIDASAPAVIEEHLLVCRTAEANHRALVDVAHVVDRRVVGIETVFLDGKVVDTSTATGIKERASSIVTSETNDGALLDIPEIVNGWVIRVVAQIGEKIDTPTPAIVEEHLLLFVAGEPNDRTLIRVTDVVDRRVLCLETFEEGIGGSSTTWLVNATAAAVVSERNLPLLTGESDSRAIVSMANDVNCWIFAIDTL
jgi:hypothetical protein